ncbi:MAG: hypothetical protein J6C37_11300 [Roseburia sp.]|nr:hypothetical protein [Roseburia sp.]
MEHFDEDLSQVMISSFAFEADSEVSSCKVSSIRLLKELPEGAELTEVGNGIKQKTNLVNADSAVSTNFTVVPVSEAPEATESISTTNIWEATAAQPVCAVSFDAVNIKSYMEDGYIHFYLYVPEGAENTGYVLELSSSGKSDSQELQFNFGRNNGYYDMNLTAGWNEIWLPIAGGSATGYIDFSAVNYVRFFAAAATETAYTYYVDGFEIVHREYVDEGVVENDDADMLWETAEDLTRAGGNGEPQFIELTEYGKTGYGILNVAAAAGTYQYARYSINEVQHLADYSGGYLHMSVYVEDEEALQGLGSLIMEISSRVASDTHEIQWAINAANTQLEAGWNEIYLPLTKAYYNMGSGGYLDLNRVNYFRLFFTGNTEAVDLILADMYVTMTCPESVDEGTLIEVGITKTTPEAPAVTGSYDAAIDDETFTYTVDAIEGAQYRMDEGEWQDCNIFENIEPESTHVFEARVKGTKYVRTGKVGSSGEVVFDKLQQNAPNSFTLTFALNKDGKTYTATIPAVENALYSFDGVTYSAENTKTDCQQGSSYTGYIKYAATVTYDESEAVTDTQTAPVLEDEKDDEDTPDTPGTENGGGSNGTSGTENGGNTTDTSGTGNSGSNTDGGSTTITGTVSNAGTNANANTNASVSDSASPETGDTSVSILAVAVIAILGIALIAISYCYKKKKEA